MPPARLAAARAAALLAGGLRLALALGAVVVDAGRSAAVLGVVCGLLVIVGVATAWPAVPREPSEALHDLG